MTEPIALPALDEGQMQSWHALMDLYERINADWTLIGGQLVHLHCAERGVSPVRPTNDIDTVVDVRASPTILATFTGVLKELGFVPEISGDGIQHRWRRDAAQIDVLIPEGVGARASARTGAGGATTVAAPGTSQALKRSEPMTIVAEGRTGTVLRPNLFVILASLMSARDFREAELARKDRKRLRTMLSCCREDDSAMSVENSVEALGRLERAAKLND